MHQLTLMIITPIINITRVLMYMYKRNEKKVCSEVHKVAWQETALLHIKCETPKHRDKTKVNKEVLPAYIKGKMVEKQSGENTLWKGKQKQFVRMTPLYNITGCILVILGEYNILYSTNTYSILIPNVTFTKELFQIWTHCWNQCHVKIWKRWLETGNIITTPWTPFDAW